MKLNKKIVIGSQLLIIVLYFQFKSQETSSHSTTQAQTMYTRKPSANQNQRVESIMNKEKSTIIAPEEIEKMIKSVRSPENFDKLRTKLNMLDNENQKKIIFYLHKKFYPVTNLRYTLRALDIFQILFKKNPSLINSDLQHLFEILIKENNPPIVRGVLRTLGELDSHEAIDILTDNITHEDFTLSLEAIQVISNKIENHDDYCTKKQIDLKIIKQVQYLETHGLNTSEVMSTAILALTKIKTKISFTYLSKLLEKSDVNLTLKNKIAESLPNWGIIALPELKKHLQYLNSLEKEQDALADQNRINGLKVTLDSIKRIQI